MKTRLCSGGHGRKAWWDSQPTDASGAWPGPEADALQGDLGKLPGNAADDVCRHLPAWRDGGGHAPGGAVPGFTDVEMVPAYELEGSREHWAEFYVILSRDIDDSFDIGHDIIRREVRRAKKISGLDRYRFLYRIQDARLEECIRPSCYNTGGSTLVQQ